MVLKHHIIGKILPDGNCTSSNLVTAIQEFLNGFADTFAFEVIYHPARGTISIQGKSEGVSSNNKVLVPSDFGTMNWVSNTDSDYPWKSIEGNIQIVYISNLRSINGVLRDTEMMPLHQVSGFYKSYESGFIGLLNVHNIYLHCTNLGHFNSIGVRGESITINTYLVQVVLVI